MTHGWDGAWFLRAYDHFGDKVGSHTCQEGQIFIESQGMCIMAGLGLDNGMAALALDSVQQAPGYSSRYCPPTACLYAVLPST